VKGVIFQHEAAAQADTARALWVRADDVISTIEWTLARDQSAGVPLVAGGALRLVIFPGAKSVGMPNAECIFEDTHGGVIIHDLEFS
jgi:hypothetical protein